MKTILNVLNLEDEAVDAELNQTMLAARWPECRLTRVQTRTEFIAQLETGGYDVILSDFTLPAFRGNEALALAREKAPNVPFIFVSGTIGEDTAIEALKSGATDYVLKHRLLRLIPAVERALGEFEARRERDHAEQAMRESEHKYRELFECLTDAAFLADEKSGKVIDTNRGAEALVHRPRTEILGHKQTEFLKLHPNGDPAAEPAILQCDLIQADGHTAPVEVRTTRIQLYGRPLVLRLCHEVGGGQ